MVLWLGSSIHLHLAIDRFAQRKTSSSSSSRSARDTRIVSLERKLVASLGHCHCHVLQLALQGVNDGGRNSSGKRDGNDGRGAKERHESAPTDSKGRGDRTCR